MQKKRIVKLHINKNKCKGCNFCVLFCPQKKLELDTRVNDKGFKVVKENITINCTGCGMCFLMCPDGCIEIE